MYCITDTCFLCLKNNIKVKSVLIEDSDGIVLHEKLGCLFPEIIDSTPDEHKLVCSECLEKLRISYDFKQSVICSNTVFRVYIDKLKCQYKSYQQLSVLLARLDHLETFPFTKSIKVENRDEKYETLNLNIKNENENLISIKEEQLNIHNTSYELTTYDNTAFVTKQETNLEAENIEIVNHSTDDICMKQEPLVDISSNCSDKELKESKDYFQCQHCPLSFSLQKYLQTHSSRCKNRPGKVQKNDSTTSNNSENNDPQEPPKLFKCNMCHKAFYASNALTRHTRVHTGERPYKCLVCHKTFTEAGNRNKHQSTHTNEKSHKCDICGKAFNQKCHLVKHKRTHNSIRPYQCTFCSKSFTASSNLASHLSSHTGQYQCDVCQYTHSHKSALQRHMRSHTGEKPYECTVCKRTFSQSSTLTTHMRLHTGEKPFQCHVCPFKCTHRNSLQYHSLSHP